MSGRGLGIPEVIRELIIFVSALLVMIVMKALIYYKN